MCLLYCIPIDVSFNHAKESVDLFTVNMFDNWASDAAYSKISNYTDSLMINNALCRPYDSVIENAMLNPRYIWDGAPMTEFLVNMLNETGGGTPFNYARYWHGYLLFIIPGLQVFNIGELRWISMAIQFLLTALIVLKLHKREPALIGFYVVIALFINPVTTALTFQEADIYLIMIVSLLIVLNYGNWLSQEDRYRYFFLINGIVVAFIDFLTYPLVALIIPLAAFVFLQPFKRKQTVSAIFISVGSWFIGYVGMWGGKWVLASLLTSENVIGDAIERSVFRINGEVANDTASVGNAVKAILNAINERTYFLMAILIVLWLICYLVFNHYSLNGNAFFTKGCFLILLGFLPIVWLIFVRNHVIIHPHMEYRQLAGTIWCLLLGFYSLFEKKSIKGHLKGTGN